MRRISTKRKKDLYSLYSLLFHLAVFIMLLISLGVDPQEKDQRADKKASLSKETQIRLKSFFASAQP